MKVIKARELGQIKKRNILKMDRKVNEFIRTQLTRQADSSLVILPE